MDGIVQCRLPGGPEVVGYHLPGLTFALGVIVRTGAAADPPGRLGASHVLEQAIFRGTTRLPPERLRQSFEDGGLRRDSALNPEWTRCWVLGLAEDLPRAVGLLLECVTEPRLDDAGVAAAVTRAQGRLVKRREQRELYVTDLLRSIIYPGHPLANPTLGTADGIAGLCAEDLRAFHRAHYRADNMIIVVAGEFDWVRVLELVEAHLPPRSATPDSPPDELRETPPAPVPLTAARVGESRPIQQLHLGLALTGPRYGDPLFYPWAVVTETLGHGYTSRLFRAVRDRLGLSYAISARLISHSCAGQVLVYGTTSAAQAGEFLTAIHRTVRSLADGGIPTDELATAKARLSSMLVMRGESTVARMHTVLTSMCFERLARDIEEIDAAIQRVTRDEVAAALSTWHPDAPIGVATVGPVPVEEVCHGLDRPDAVALPRG